MDRAAKFSAGDPVVRTTTRDFVGTVVGDRFRQNDEAWYRVRFGAAVQAVLEDDLAPAVETCEIDELLAAGLYSSNDSLARRLTLAKLKSPLRDAIYSLDAARTDFHPFQFKPLFKFLASERRRILIADEVGLGKTIEAGYILREQRARVDVDRVLIICPAALRQKWQIELGTKFGEKFDVLTAPTIREWLHRDDGRSRLQGIVSMQTLRSAGLLDLLQERAPTLDMLIVDEAHHHRNSATAQHKAVRQLCLDADAVVFLTATPLHLGNRDLYTLLNLLLPEEFDRADVFDQRLAVNAHIVRAESALRSTAANRGLAAADSLRRAAEGFDPFNFKADPTYARLLGRLVALADDDVHGIVQAREDLARLNLIAHVVTRTKKREAYLDAPKRDPKTLKVEHTEAERIAYDTVYHFCATHYQRTAGNHAAQFALITLQRQMASSIPAMLEHYRQVIAERADLGHDQEEDDDAPERPVRLVDIPGFGGLIDDLLDLPLKDQDTKVTVLVRDALAGTEKVVVFSYFRGSLRYLERRLTEAGIACVRIDGSVPYNPTNPAEDERQIRIARFRDPNGPRILLSSEVGSEGLDFQFCHRLVNWDLPWNPMVVEQRIGRLDRLGQRAKRISIINFTTPGTIEDRILTRLYDRVGLFEGAIGPLEPILGEAIKKLTADLLRPDLTNAELDELVEREALALEQQRVDGEQFDAKAESLLGHDDLVRGQIKRVRDLGRYVTPVELIRFVGDFLASDFPACALRPRHDGSRTRDAGENCWWVRATAELREFVRNKSPRLDDPGVIGFLERTANGGDLRITFDPKAAAADPAVEHAHNQHPLVKAIAACLAGAPDRVQPVACLVLPTATVPENDYAFYWAEVVEEGLQAGRSIWAEVAVHDGTGRVAPDTAERLLYEMAVAGQPWPGFPTPDATVADALYRRIQQWLSARCIERKALASAQNHTRINARAASLKASAEARLAIVRRQLNEHEAAGNTKILRPVQGKLRKIEADRDQRLRQLDDRRSVTVTYEAGGFGFVRVVRPETNTKEVAYGLLAGEG